jgi:hypothetical protein
VACLTLGEQHRLQRLDVIGQAFIELRCHVAIVRMARRLATITR